jgi:hypothetical protein
MTPAQEDYFSFEDVLGELEMGEEELKRMVSEGELRAFRDENKMKFRRDDVENLKKGRTSEPTLILPSDTDIPLEIGSPELEETSLDLETVDESLDISSVAPTLEIAGDTHMDDSEATVTEELVFDDTDFSLDTASLDAGETFIEEDGDTGLTTEPLELVGEDFATEAIAIEDDEEAIPTIEAPAQTKKRRGRRRGAAAELPPAVEAEIEARKPHWIWTFVLFLTLGSTLYASFFMYDLLRVENGFSQTPMEFTQKWGDKVLTGWYQDPEYPSMLPPTLSKEQVNVDAIPSDYRTPTWSQPAQDAIMKIQPVLATAEEQAEE